jgi:hypothetical protein
MTAHISGSKDFAQLIVHSHRLAYVQLIDHGLYSPFFFAWVEDLACAGVDKLDVFAWGWCRGRNGCRH